MKKLVAIVSVVALSACAGVQAKLSDAKAHAKSELPKVECRAKVIEPYVDLILAEDLAKYLDGVSIVEVLQIAGVAKDEFESAKAAFEACADAK